MSWIIIGAILITYFCYQIWRWADAHLFEYLGEVETCAGIEKCYAYDALTIPARIVCVLCGTAAIFVCVLTWFNVYGIIFL